MAQFHLRKTSFFLIFKKKGMSINLCIVEDDLIYSNNIKEYLEIKGVNVICQSSNVSKFLYFSQGYKVPVQIVLLDINLADGESGIDGIVKIKEAVPSAEVIVLTSHDDSRYIFQALCNGATGFLTKGMTLSEIYKSISDVINGGSCMTPSIARKVVKYFSDNTVTQKSHFDDLTSREYEIVEGIKDGLSYKLIADRLSISIETVRFHVKNIYKKLHVNSKTEVINAYYQQQSKFNGNLID